MREPISEVFNEDNMIGMARYPDKFFDLAICDPPYGIGKSWSKDRFSPFYKHRSSYNNNVLPDENYFKELFRVSKHQIIWGANYYWNFLPPSNNLIFWDKNRDPLISFNSAGELAWTSVKKYPFMKCALTWNGFHVCETRSMVHPHEKPIALYRWQLRHYANVGDKILDTHMGSQSSRIAAYNMGFDYYGWEIDKDYFEAGNKRFKEQTSQIQLF
jgi:site-specific DNA-methyltransferase (adenine-specific)